MKKTFLLLVFTILFACNQKQKDSQVKKVDTIEKVTAATRKNTIENIESDTSKYQISTFDNPEDVDQISREKESLKRLSEKKIFSDIHNKLVKKINEDQQFYFETNPNYELLSVAKGSLFQKNSDDFAFIVYDKKNVKISIILLNGITSEYNILFKDIKVVNALKNANCNFYFSKTSDYQFANEFLVNNEEYLVKSTESYLENSPVKITDISKDEDFIIKDGCFAKNVSKTNLANTLCIATSAVYNNWECLRYDKTSNTFLIFYGQAFAD